MVRQVCGGRTTWDTAARGTVLALLDARGPSPRFHPGRPGKLGEASAETWVVPSLFFFAGMMLWSTVHGHGFLRGTAVPRSGGRALGRLWGGGTHGRGGCLAGCGNGIASDRRLGFGVIVAVLIHFAALLLWPVWGRLRLRDPYVAGQACWDRSIRDLIEPRIEAAGREFGGSRPRSMERRGSLWLAADAPPTAGPIEAAGRRFDSRRGTSSGPCWGLLCPRVLWPISLGLPPSSRRHGAADRAARRGTGGRPGRRRLVLREPR